MAEFWTRVVVVQSGEESRAKWQRSRCGDPEQLRALLRFFRLAGASAKGFRFKK
jgi:hypothetical protein